MSEVSRSLTAAHSLQYTYKRSTGPILGRFFGGLRDRRILGVRRADGRVLVPPREYDPDTGEALSELVEVASTGTVVSWAWVSKPREKQPLGRPFAYALVKLDGADTPLLHAVDAGGDPSALRTGLRVRARFAAERSGGVRDIEAFEPAEGAPAEAGWPRALAERDLPEPVELLKIPVKLDYLYSAGQAATRFLQVHRRGPAARPALPGGREGLLPDPRRLPRARSTDRGRARSR